MPRRPDTSFRRMVKSKLIKPSPRGSGHEQSRGKRDPLSDQIVDEIKKATQELEQQVKKEQVNQSSTNPERG